MIQFWIIMVKTKVFYVIAQKKLCYSWPTSCFFYRHVQINNDSAIAFYQKFGFNIVETKPAYYKRIEPADAHVLQKNLVKGGGKGSKAVIG